VFCLLLSVCVCVFFCCLLIGEIKICNDGVPTVPSSTGRCAVIGRKLEQNANEGCNSCGNLAGLVLRYVFIAGFILLVIAL